MSHTPRRLPRLPPLHPPGTAGVPDADLLARWAAHRDEAAFELLVRRHAPLVLSACRRVLTDPDDADDAAQAAFLVLARKAASVARGDALPAWLHKVSVRAALRLRAARARRLARHEPAVVDHLPAPHKPDPAWLELHRVLDEEVARLPERHRAAFVLCCLGGHTGEEAGRLLGCPPGTVSSRLTRARERLRDRLAARGFAPAVATAALVAIPSPAPAAVAAVPRSLIESVLLAAPAFAAGHSPGGVPSRPAALAEGVLAAMTPTTLRLAALLLAAGLAAAGAVLAGSGGDPDQRPAPDKPLARAEAPPAADGKTPPPAPVAVRLVKPQPGGLDRVLTTAGTTEAALRADLPALVPGVVREVRADLGDKVKAGQLLAEIDAPDLLLDERRAAAGVAQAEGLLKEAEAKVATARAEAEVGKGSVRQREAELAGAKANLDLRKRQVERAKQLMGQKVVGAGEVGDAEGQYGAAQAQAEAAAAAVETARGESAVRESKTALAAAGVGTAKADVDAARVGLEKARLAVARTRVVAPFDGVVSRRGCAPGDAVRPGDGGAAATLFTVLRADGLRVVVSVPERHITRVAPGVEATVSYDALPGVKVAGKVARVGVVVDPRDGTVRAEIDIPNPDGKVRPGMSGRVTLTFGKGPADALRVPATAVRQVSDATGGRWDEVYVVKDGKARRTKVRVEYRDSREAEVASGLTATDLVVEDPQGFFPRDEVPVAGEKPAPPK